MRSSMLASGRSRSAQPCMGVIEDSSSSSCASAGAQAQNVPKSSTAITAAREFDSVLRTSAAMTPVELHMTFERRAFRPGSASPLLWAGSAARFSGVRRVNAMKYLHTMVRVTDLAVSLRFYCEALGLREVRRRDHEKGRFTLVFLAAPGDDAAQVELTYNWDP